MRPHMVIPPQQIPPSTEPIQPIYKRSSTCSRALNTRKFVLGSASPKILNTKSADYMAIDLEYTPYVEKTLYTRFKGGIFGAACRHPKCRPLTCRV